MAVDLSLPIRDVLVSNVNIASQLSTYLNTVAVFTRRPVPVDAEYPMIVVSTEVSKTNVDGINDSRAVIVSDIIVYGNNDNADHYRTVRSVSELVFDLFHRTHRTLSPLFTVPGWFVVQTSCTGPIPAPADDEQTVGRAVTLTTLLAQLRS